MISRKEITKNTVKEFDETLRKIEYDMGAKIIPFLRCADNPEYLSLQTSWGVFVESWEKIKKAIQ